MSGFSLVKVDFFFHYLELNQPVNKLRTTQIGTEAFGVKEGTRKGEQPNINMTWNLVYERDRCFFLILSFSL